MTDNVTVTVEWAQQIAIVYSARTSPMVPVTFYCNESTLIMSLQLVLEYNIEYNLSVMAILSCGADATASIALNYGEAYYQILSQTCF